MELYEEGDNRTRLVFPASVRDEYNLLEVEYLRFEIDCDRGSPIVALVPVEDGTVSGLVRRVTSNSADQVTVSFPRHLAQALGLIGVELRTEGTDRRILLRPDNTSGQASGDD